MNEIFDNLKKSLSNKSVDLIGVINLTSIELSVIIILLDQIIDIAVLNSKLATVIELRQFYLNRANAKLYLNQYNQALNDYEKVKSLLQMGERDFEMHYLKALDGISWSKARIGNYSDALKDCNELIAISIGKRKLLSKFFTVRGACYKETGNLIFAERSFELANIDIVFLDTIIAQEGDESLPSGLTAIGYNALGNRFFSHQIFDDAMLSYEKAIKVNPLYSRAYFNKGVLLAQKDQHNQAIRFFSKSINLEPTFMDAYLNRGNEYCEISDFDSAVLDYSACLLANPRNETASENMAYAKSKLG